MNPSLKEAPGFQASWDVADSDHGDDDDQNMFTSPIDDNIDFEERDAAVGCMELSTASSSYGRFKFLYFFIALIEQFGFYWLLVFGSIEQGGFNGWMRNYLISYSIGACIAMCTCVFLGRLSDRMGRKYLFLLSVLIRIAPFCVIAYAPDKVQNALYVLPLVGLCGSMSTQTGIANAYIADALPLNFAVSGFIKLVSIFGAADIVAKGLVFAMLTEEVSSFVQFVPVSETRIMAIVVIGLYVCICLLCVCFLPESLSQDRRTPYSQRNPCHGISYTCSKLLAYVGCLTFLCRFAQIGITSVTHDLLLMTTPTIYAGDVASDYMDVFRNGEQLSVTQILNEEVVIYAVFVLALASTLVCAPCYLSCFCGRVLRNMLCSMLLLLVSFALLIFILFSTQWYQFIAALFAGGLFGFGEIGFAFLYGAMVKYINSKQYGIAYGVIAAAYNASTAGAPYAFYVLFVFTTRVDSIPAPFATYFADAKSVAYLAVLVTCLALLCYIPVKSSMSEYADGRRPHQEAQARQHARLATLSPELQEGRVEREMAPPPAMPMVQVVHSPLSQPPVVEIAESVASSQYVVGQYAPQYQQQPYVAAASAHQPNWTWMQQQQQPQQPGAAGPGHVDQYPNQYPQSISPVYQIQHNANMSYASSNNNQVQPASGPYFFANANAV